VPDALQDPLEGSAIEFLVVDDEDVCFAQVKILREAAEGGGSSVERCREPFKRFESRTDKRCMTSPHPLAEVPERFACADAPRPLVLIVDDEPLLRRSLRRILEGGGYRIALADSAETAQPLFADPELGAVLADAERGSGYDILERVKRARSDVEVIVMTGGASIDCAVRSIRRGAFDYLAKPFDDVIRVRNTVGRALERVALVRRNRELERALALPEGAPAPEVGTGAPGDLGAKLPVSLAAYERCALERALWESGGDAAAAAARLGIGRSTLYRKLARHNLAPRRERGGTQNAMG
jgi:DNA-binding NtrC family response regulator